MWSTQQSLAARFKVHYYLPTTGHQDVIIYDLRPERKQRSCRERVRRFPYAIVPETDEFSIRSSSERKSPDNTCIAVRHLLSRRPRMTSNAVVWLPFLLVLFLITSLPSYFFPRYYAVVSARS